MKKLSITVPATMYMALAGVLLKTWTLSELSE